MAFKLRMRIGKEYLAIDTTKIKGAEYEIAITTLPTQEEAQNPDYASKTKGTNVMMQGVLEMVRAGNRWKDSPSPISTTRRGGIGARALSKHG